MHFSLFRRLTSTIALLAVVSTLLSPLSPAVSAQATVTIESVEIRPNRSLRLTWNHTGAQSYDISVVTSGNEPSTSLSVAGISEDGTTMRRILGAGDEWSPTLGVDYELAIRPSGGEWSQSAPVSVPNGAVQVDASMSGSSITVNWSGLPNTLRPIRWDIFAASEGHMLRDCRQAGEPHGSASSSTLTEFPSCMNQAVDPSEDYTIGVRAVLNESPLVVTSIEAATAGTVAAESNGVALIDGTWTIVDQQGQPDVWNGVNLRRGDYGYFVGNNNEFNAMVDNGFDTIRLAMNWSRFQPDFDSFNAASFNQLDAVIAGAEAAGIGVILDPIHVAGGGERQLPDWAWQQTNDGQAWSYKMVPLLDETAHEYLTHVVQRYRDEPTVIAIDLVNEPRETVGSQLAQSNWHLADLYHDLIETVRDVDEDKPLILEAYYGSAAIDPATLQSVRHATTADPNPDATDFHDLIWSLHDYYLGNEGDATDDGYTSDGYPDRGHSPDGTLQRSESWDGQGCYPSGPSPSDCTKATSRRKLLRPSQQLHVERHFAAAQTAEMALFVGEYGIPHPGGSQQGWTGGDQLFSDKYDLYESMGLSRTAWAWSTEVDVTYGLYTRSSSMLHSWASYASGQQSIPPEGTGDVSCDNRLSIQDAFFIAQHLVGLRHEAACDVGEARFQLSEGDINGDGFVTIGDALLIARCEAGYPNAQC